MYHARDWLHAGPAVSHDRRVGNRATPRRFHDRMVEEEYTPEDAQAALKLLTEACQAATAAFADQHQQWSTEASAALSAALLAKVQACHQS